MRNPKVSIVIPVYNVERYIERCLTSVIRQSISDIEILVIDDGSTDRSKDIALKYQKEDSRVHVYSIKNSGVSAARNAGLKVADGDFLMFLDADDVLYPNAIEKMYKKITADNDLMAVGCHLEYVNEHSKKIGGGLFLGETTKEGFYEKAKNRKLVFMQPTAVYNRELALSVGGYIVDGYPKGKPRYQDYCEDLDLWTRMSDLYTEGKAIIVIPEVLCKYRKIGNGLSANSFNMILKMRYTKKNLLLRRDGKKEMTFVEFYNSLTAKELKRLKHDAKAANSLRNGVFYLKRKRLFKGAWEIVKSIWYRPGYIVDKLKHNFLKKK